MIHCNLFMNLPVCLCQFVRQCHFLCQFDTSSIQRSDSLSISITGPAKPHATLKFSLRLFWTRRITKRYDKYIFQDPKNFLSYI